MKDAQLSTGSRRAFSFARFGGGDGAGCSAAERVDLSLGCGRYAGFEDRGHQALNEAGAREALANLR